MESKFKLIKKEENQTPARNNLRAAIYARYSSIGNSPLSAEEQVLRIRSRLSNGMIRSRKFPSAEIEIDDSWVVKDEAVSGRTVVGREGYELIKSGIKNTKFDILLADDISRLSRDLGDTLDLWEALNFSEVEGVSIADGISTFDPNSKDLFIFKGYANEHQAKNIAKNTIRGLEIRILNGFSTGHLPFGYYSVPTKFHFIKGVEKSSHFEIHIKQEEAETVRRIWSLYAENVGLRVVAKTLTDEGIAPPSRGRRRRKQQRWSQQTVRNILNNEKYLGIWTDRKTQTKRNPLTGKMVQRPRPKDECLSLSREDLRIVSPEIADQVRARQQRIRSEREKAATTEQSIFGSGNAQPKHLFIGTLKCGVCGGNMMVASGKAGGYLGCSNAYQHRAVACTNRRVLKMSLLEERLIREIKRQLDCDHTYEYIAQRYNKAMLAKHSDLPMRTSQVEKEISDTARAIENYVKFIATGNLSEAVSNGLRKSEQKLERLKEEEVVLKQRARNQVFVTPMAIKKRFEDLETILGQKVAEANRRLRALLPEKVTLTPEVVENKTVWRVSGMLNLYDLVRFSAVKIGVPWGIRTPVTSVKGRCPRPG